ncbi:MAG: transketolase [Patescibacteria group bacterium]
MNTEELAKQIRISSLKMCHDAKSSHIGSALSCADILAVLYNEILQKDDKLIISKGHCASAVYSALYHSGKGRIGRNCIKQPDLDFYSQNGEMLGGHVTFGIAGVEVSTGSLGHGLAIGCGMAMVHKGRIFVLMGDGETNEGSVWEATRFASEQKLDNLIVIIDNNKLQSFSKCNDNLRAKFEAFGWMVKTTSGNNVSRLSATLNHLRNHHFRMPKCVVAHTVKGKGVSFIENRMDWHYKYPNDEELKMALSELQ